MAGGVCYTASMNKTILGSIIAFLLAGGAAGYGYTVIRDNDADIFESSVHQVVRVVDGDTLDLENEVRVRLIGIDSPERTDYGYAEASAFLDKLVAGKHVRVEKDISGSDRFERLLSYVYLVADDVKDDDVLVNEAMVRAGYAKTLSMAPDNRYRDLFSSAQDEARRKGLGIWGLCE